MGELIDDATRDRVWDFLAHANIPAGWLPQNVDDPILAGNVRSSAG